MNFYKSQGEKAIAEVLEKYNIKFEYEHPFLIKHLENEKEKLSIWYPDFWLPNYSIIIEFWGMENNENYDKRKRKKLDAYKALDIDCISVKPSTIKGDLKSYLLIRISTFLNNKVRHFKNRNNKIIS
jgi:hypothetical protein